MNYGTSKYSTLVVGDSIADAKAYTLATNELHCAGKSGSNP
jgi:hypothetical protein